MIKDFKLLFLKMEKTIIIIEKVTSSEGTEDVKSEISNKE
jgi:hypothetical protein